MPNQNPHGGVLLYQTEDGKMQIEVTLENEIVWLSIDQMAELFQRNKYFQAHQGCSGKRRAGCGFSCCIFCNNCG